MLIITLYVILSYVFAKNSIFEAKDKNNRIWIREIPEQSPNICKYFGLFCHKFGTRNARKSIKDSKDSYYTI